MQNKKILFFYAQNRERKFYIFYIFIFQLFFGSKNILILQYHK